MNLPKEIFLEWLEIQKKILEKLDHIMMILYSINDKINIPNNKSESTRKVQQWIDMTREK